MADSPGDGSPPAEAHHATRSSILRMFSSLGALARASLRPLPTETGDGTYVEHAEHASVLSEISALRLEDLRTVKDLLSSEHSSKGTDDRTYLMERIIQLASEMPADSQVGDKLTSDFLGTLWSDLKHPPHSSLDPSLKYRSADGSFNNIHQPSLGAAGSSYARTVQPETVQVSALPDPGLLFDSLMARDSFEPHPTKISSILFYLATIIVHDVFRTSHADVNISTASSYLDLAPLYGHNQSEQNKMRTFAGGMLKADCFSDERLLGFPPGVGCLLIMFNRFHNHVAEQLAAINEGNRFPRPISGQIKLQIQHDEDLFQTARLITCGLYINIILKDYVRVILNLNRTDSVWDLDPRSQPGASETLRRESPGLGNQVSAEFNLVYRWHSGVSERDEHWIEEKYKEIFRGVDPATLSMGELLQGLKRWQESLPTDPQQRPFANLERDSEGRLDDKDLVRIFVDGVEDVAGAFGARRVPKVLRVVEVLGILQSRKWNLATLNEFRAHFKLQRYTSFDEINPDPVIADQLRHLYGQPDLVELYPGLVVEDAKKAMVPGSGLCTSFTVSRAILSDAVSLVRGDRFYTLDYTPRNLTSWGAHEVASDTNVDQGHVFYKLVLRALPNHFTSNSVYAHFPMTVPWENKKIHFDLGISAQYDYNGPSYLAPPILVNSYSAAMQILNDLTLFKVTWGEAISFLMKHDGRDYGKDFMLAGDAKANSQSRALMCPVLYQKQWQHEIGAFYEKTTQELLRRHTARVADTNMVDIVRDIGNLAHAHFAAEMFGFPLKTEANPRGIYTESELYLIMALVFTSIFFDADPTKSFPLRQAARRATQQLGDLYEAMLEPLAAGKLVRDVIERFRGDSSLSKYGTHMITSLLDQGYSVKELVWTHILPTAGGSVANQAQLFAQCLDFYLEDANQHHWQAIQQLARADTVEADAQLLHYAMEGARLRCSVGVFRRVEDIYYIRDGEGVKYLKDGDHVLVNLTAASRDPTAFPNPEQVDLNRPLESYIHYGAGSHRCLGLEMTRVALVTMLKTVARLPNLRRVPGPQGQICNVPTKEGFARYLTVDGSSYFPFPTSLKVFYDDPVDDKDSDKHK